MLTVASSSASNNSNSSSKNKHLNNSNSNSHNNNHNKSPHHHVSCVVCIEHVCMRVVMCAGEGGGSGKERSAETGQEGLEDVPDYQDSLRQYALGLAEQEEKNSTETKDQASEEDGKSGSKRDSPSSQNQHPSRGQNKRQDTLNHLDNSNQKKWREHFTSGHSYPPASPSMMPNGYPIPPYGPHMPPYPPHQQMPPPEMMMRRNGGGFPPHPLDPYYSGHPSYRMPYYPGPPTHPTLHKQGEWCVWKKMKLSV